MSISPAPEGVAAVGSAFVATASTRPPAAWSLATSPSTAVRWPSSNGRSPAKERMREQRPITTAAAPLQISSGPWPRSTRKHIRLLSELKPISASRCIPLTAFRSSSDAASIKASSMTLAPISG